MPEQTTVHIAARMTALVDHLKKVGINGIRFPEVTPQCKEDWSERYATVCSVFFYPPIDLGPYESFDEDALWYDLVLLLKQWFGTNAVDRHNYGHRPTYPDGTVHVIVYESSQEIEAYVVNNADGLPHENA